jgi:hypothetical protein
MKAANIISRTFIRIILREVNIKVNLRKENQLHAYNKIAAREPLGKVRSVLE